MSFCLLDRESKENYTSTERLYKYNFTNLSSLEANTPDRVGPFSETGAHTAYNRQMK